MQARWCSGVYLGRRLESNEILVTAPEGKVVKARDFKEVPDNVAWDPELLKEIKKQRELGTRGLLKHDQYLSKTNLSNLEVSDGEDQEYGLLAIRASRKEYKLARKPNSGRHNVP